MGDKATFFWMCPKIGDLYRIYHRNGQVNQGKSMLKPIVSAAGQLGDTQFTAVDTVNCCCHIYRLELCVILISTVEPSS